MTHGIYEELTLIKKNMECRYLHNVEMMGKAPADDRVKYEWFNEGLAYAYCNIFRLDIREEAK